MNFLAVLCDGLTDKGITQKEIVHVIFTDSETHLPVLNFSYNCTTCKTGSSRTQQVITDSFKENSLESALVKIFFLSSGWASVKSGKNSGLIKLFHEG